MKTRSGDEYKIKCTLTGEVSEDCVMCNNCEYMFLNVKKEENECYILEDYTEDGVKIFECGPLLTIDEND